MHDLKDFLTIGLPQGRNGMMEGHGGLQMTRKMNRITNYILIVHGDRKVSQGNSTRQEEMTYFQR